MTWTTTKSVILAGYVGFCIQWFELLTASKRTQTEMIKCSVAFSLAYISGIETAMHRKKETCIFQT